MEEAPAGPVAAVVEAANNAVEAANNLLNNPLSAVQSNVFQNIIPEAANNAVEAANNFFNNPLSAVQPNVFQNIIPGVKEAIEYLLLKKLNLNIQAEADVRDKIRLFFEDLKKSRGLIAGGFVLAAIEIIPHLNAIKEIESQPYLNVYSNVDKDVYLDKIENILFRVSDIDIYVNIDNFPYLFGRLFDKTTLGYFRNDDGLYKKYRSSIYCESFLRRNGIKAVHRYRYPASRHVSTFHFDVMTVRNKHSPLQVVNNFDLTFCQVWFDGEDCYATYPDHVNKKEGWVQQEYLPVLFRGNRFIKDRIKKYRWRGYKILQNPKLTPELAKAILEQTTQAVLDGPPTLCDSVTKPVKRYDDPAFLRKWAIRMILDYATTWGLPKDRDQNYFKPIIEEFKFDMMWRSRHDVPNFNSIKQRARIYGSEPFDGINPDDGYDTEDYDTEPNLAKLKDVFVNIFEDNEFAKGIEPDTATEDDKTLVFYRFTNQLLLYLYKEVNTNDIYLTQNIGETLTDVEEDLFNVAPKLKEASKKYLTVLREICIRKATEDLLFASEGDEVFDIHNHPIDKAISAEVLEGYLNQYISQPNHESVPCYNFVSGDPTSCQEKLKFEDIRYIVSPEFYKKYSKPAPIKTGLNQSITGLNITLENTKSEDPAGFGEIYHYTMCPFCLQLENRDEGCAYMTHSNPKRRPEDDTPYCLDQFVVDAIRNKYIEAGRQIFADEGLNDLPLHLEFCIECGRPCLNHEHFDLNDPPRLIPSHDPGKCDGGGRAELFARILAVRQVYRDGTFTFPKAERLAAAMAADGAPKNADLMARGTVISDMPPTERIWGNANIPSSKNYNDPAYRNTAENENNNNAGSNTASENSFNAAAYGFGDNEEAKVPEDEEPVVGGQTKYRKGKGYRLTRKLGKQKYKKSKATKRHA